jgi:hypothetical protein
MSRVLWCRWRGDGCTGSNGRCVVKLPRCAKPWARCPRRRPPPASSRLRSPRRMHRWQASAWRCVGKSPPCGANGDWWAPSTARPWVRQRRRVSRCRPQLGHGWLEPTDFHPACLVRSGRSWAALRLKLPTSSRPKAGSSTPRRPSPPMAVPWNWCWTTRAKVVRRSLEQPFEALTPALQQAVAGGLW